MTSDQQEKNDTVSDSQETSNELSFAEMMNETPVELDFHEPGEKVSAVVVRISKDFIFLDLGGKSEGVLAASELLGEDGNLTVKEGDTVEAYFLTVERNEKIFTTKMSGAAAQAHLAEAFRSQIPLEGTVTKEIKGGFDVKIGAVRAFCPFSQMSLRRVEDTSQFVDLQLAFKIIEYKENGRNIIVSHRVILEEERQEKKEELKTTLQEGMTVTGTITSIQPFGAFVDIGGIEGLIPISEISWGRVEDIHAILEPGQQVEVAALKLDWDNDRFSFSLKETLPDPWQTVSEKFEEGINYTGIVARLADFGAFVTLAPGIDGLVHISNLGGGRRINHPREVVQQGEELEVRIDSIDPEEKRISLSVPHIDKEKAKRKEQFTKKKGGQERDDNKADYQRFVDKKKKKPSGSMGTLGDLLKAKMGKK